MHRVLSPPRGDGRPHHCSTADRTPLIHHLDMSPPVYFFFPFITLHRYRVLYSGPLHSNSIMRNLAGAENLMDSPHRLLRTRLLGNSQSPPAVSSNSQSHSHSKVHVIIAHQTSFIQSNSKVQVIIAHQTSVSPLVSSPEPRRKARSLRQVAAAPRYLE